MKLLEDYVHDKDIKKISFETNRKSDAISFYKKLGYKINKDRISMEKETKPREREEDRKRRP